MKKIYLIKTILAAIIILTISCKKTENPPLAEPEVPFDLVVAKTQIETAGEAYVIALNKGDSIGLANCYTSDAKFMQPNAKTVEGRANIQKLFSQWMKGGMPKFSMKTVGIWGNQENMFAEEEWTFSDKNGKILDSGKALEIFKMEDGKWKLYRDCYNSDMPCPK